MDTGIICHEHFSPVSLVSKCNHSRDMTTCPSDRKLISFVVRNSSQHQDCTSTVHNGGMNGMIPMSQFNKINFGSHTSHKDNAFFICQLSSDPTLRTILPLISQIFIKFLQRCLKRKLNFKPFFNELYAFTFVVPPRANSRKSLKRIAF